MNSTNWLRPPLAALMVLWLVAGAAVCHAQITRDDLLDLGTKEGIGGDDFQAYERSKTKDIIRNVFPPLFRPALVGHAFVLPKGLWNVSLSGRFATLEGTDFFANGHSEEATFGPFQIDRQLYDLDVFYGFDLGGEGLHDFTLRINVPFMNSAGNGSIHPDGVPLINVFNQFNDREFGDVGIFVKKKVVDQADWPVQIAVAGGIRLPTGSNDLKFANDGRVQVLRPDPGGTGNPGAPPLNMPIPIPVLAGATRVFTPFPFNRDDPTAPASTSNPGRFFRFSDDGRLPTTLQAGTGETGYTLGLFFTRQMLEGDILGRGALHAGMVRDFRGGSDGIEFGDLTKYFVSLVKPITQDSLSLDLTFLALDQEDDHYPGTFITPFPTDAAGNAVPLSSASHVTFRSVNRPKFVGGTTTYFAPHLIFSPDPAFRISLGALFRMAEPDFGPAPETIYRFGIEYTF